MSATAIYCTRRRFGSLRLHDEAVVVEDHVVVVWEFYRSTASWKWTPEEENCNYLTD